MPEANIWSNVTIPNGKDIPYLDHTKYLTVLVPTANNTMNIDSMISLYVVAKQLNKTLNFCAAAKHGIPSSRGHCMEIAKSYYGVDRIRALWLDSDIAILTPTAVTNAIKEADRRNITIIGNYKIGSLESLQNVLFKDMSTQHPYTDDDLQNMNDMDPIMGFGGMGFMYGDVDLNYNVWADKFSGEDYNYIKDQKIQPYYAKHVRLGHNKNLIIKS